MVAFFAGAALVEDHRAAYCKGYGASHEEEGDDYTSIGWGGANDCICHVAFDFLLVKGWTEWTLDCDTTTKALIGFTSRACGHVELSVLSCFDFVFSDQGPSNFTASHFTASLQS